jgi:hypothetical protein
VLVLVIDSLYTEEMDAIPILEADFYWKDQAEWLTNSVYCGFPQT